MPKGSFASEDGKLDAIALIEEAQRTAGLSDWGEDDFRSPLKVLVNAAETEADLSAIGRERLRTWLLLRLEQRLRMIDDRKRLPGIAAQVIDRPVAIMGLPRAGTTYLHRLMSLKPDMLAMLYWQLFLGSPPANDPAIDHRPQIERFRKFMEFQGWFSPEIMRTHNMDPQEPEEDIFTFEYSMVSMYFTGYLDVPSYLQYIFERGFTDAFAWHRRALQALQYGMTGKRFMLKAPGYTVFTEQLIAEYPDITLIQNHRDPSKVMASVFSTMSASRVTMSDRPQLIGREEALAFMEMYNQGLMASAAKREDPGYARRFIDVHYIDLERDPVGCVRRAYAHADIEFTPADQLRIEEWIAHNRKGRHGKHRYALADYGVTQSDVHAIFADYIERFGIEREQDA